MGLFKDLKKVKKNFDKTTKKANAPKSKQPEPEPKLHTKSFKLTRFNVELYAKSDGFDLAEGDDGYEIINDDDEVIGGCPSSVTDFLDKHIDDFNGCVDVDRDGKATVEFIW